MSTLRSASVTKPIARAEVESSWGRGAPLNDQRTPSVKCNTNNFFFKVTVAPADYMTKFTFPYTHFILALSVFREKQMNIGKGIQVMAPYTSMGIRF